MNTLFQGMRTKALLDRNGLIRQTYPGVKDVETIRDNVNALLAK